MKGINVEVRDEVLENENVIYVAKPHENQSQMIIRMH